MNLVMANQTHKAESIINQMRANLFKHPDILSQEVDSDRRICVNSVLGSPTKAKQGKPLTGIEGRCIWKGSGDCQWVVKLVGPIMSDASTCPTLD